MSIEKRETQKPDSDEADPGILVGKFIIKHGERSVELPIGSDENQQGSVGEPGSDDIESDIGMSVFCLGERKDLPRKNGPPIPFNDPFEIGVSNSPDLVEERDNLFKKWQSEQE